MTLSCCLVGVLGSFLGRGDLWIIMGLPCLLGVHCVLKSVINHLLVLPNISHLNVFHPTDGTPHPLFALCTLSEVPHISGYWDESIKDVPQVLTCLASIKTLRFFRLVLVRVRLYMFSPFPQTGNPGRHIISYPRNYVNLVLKWKIEIYTTYKRKFDTILQSFHN